MHHHHIEQVRQQLRQIDDLQSMMEDAPSSTEDASGAVAGASHNMPSDEGISAPPASRRVQLNMDGMVSLNGPDGTVPSSWPGVTPQVGHGVVVTGLEMPLSADCMHPSTFNRVRQAQVRLHAHSMS